MLAAGSSRRFGGDKLCADVDGRPLLGVTIDVARAQVAVERILVVVPPADQPRRDVARARGARVVESVHAARGMRWSIHAGLDAVVDGTVGAVVVLGDDPLAARSLQPVLAAAAHDPGRPVAVRRSSGAPHPVYLPRATWPARPGHDDDTGLRALLGADTRWVDGDAAGSHDVDEPGDLDAVRSRFGA